MCNPQAIAPCANLYPLLPGYHHEISLSDSRLPINCTQKAGWYTPKPKSTHILAATSTRAIRPAFRFASAPFRIASTTLRMALSKSAPESVVLMIFCKRRWDSSTSRICQSCDIHRHPPDSATAPISRPIALSYCDVHLADSPGIRACLPRRQTPAPDVSSHKS